MLDIVKHESIILKIFPWLHAFDEVHSTSRSIYQYLEDIHLILPFAWKDVVMDVFNFGIPLHYHDATIFSSLAATSR